MRSLWFLLNRQELKVVEKCGKYCGKVGWRVKRFYKRGLTL